MKYGFSSVIVLLVSAAVTAAAAGALPKPVDVGVKHASDAVERGTLPVEPTKKAPSASFKTLAAQSAQAAAAADPPIGTVRLMPVLDDAFDTYRFRGFTLRAVGEHIEVWVQQGVVPGFPATTVGTLDFPAGDCRNDGVRNVVTNEQIASLIHQFDTNIYPKESATFSVPPTRSGTKAQLPGLLGLPDDYYVGDGDKIVTLISNVRGHELLRQEQRRPAHVHRQILSSQIDAFFDRNVMTIDAFDWCASHRGDPPDNPSTDACASAPARPLVYEGVLPGARYQAPTREL